MENNNLLLWDAVRSVPKEYQEKITGGRLKNLTSIKPIFRLFKLTEMFGPCGIGWHYEIRDRRIETAPNGEVIVFVEVALFTADSKPIIGNGGAHFYIKENGGYRTDNDAFKKATTDAISSACKMLGIGADVYAGFDEAEKELRDVDPNEQNLKIVTREQAVLSVEEKKERMRRKIEEAKQDGKV